MSDAIISVENLSKVYRIRHQQTGQRYTALRDVIAQKLAAPFRRIAERNAAAGENPAVEDFWALKDVSFEIKPGEVVGIIGRNGAGKSTLLKILSRITEPTKGCVRLKGRVASLLEVGTGFHPELTGRENVFLNGAILGMTKVEIRRKFDEIVAFAEVEKFLDTPVKRYSSGMYVRLAFAVAAHLEPEILIVDEVLAVGDAQFQKKCLGKMQDMSRAEGRTVLFVSHNMPAIEALCRKGIWLDSGGVVALGEAKTVVQQYLNESSKRSQAKLASGQSNIIRAFSIRNAAGQETETFGVGEDIVFEVELFHPTFLDTPRLSINVHSPNGERLVTIHTDIQQNEKWSFQGVKRVRAVWKNNRMVSARYRVDVSLWGHSSGIDSLIGVKSIDIAPRDVYGTGVLPNPSFQGFYLPEVCWEMNAASKPPTT